MEVSTLLEIRLARVLARCTVQRASCFNPSRDSTRVAGEDRSGVQRHDAVSTLLEIRHRCILHHEPLAVRPGVSTLLEIRQSLDKFGNPKKWILFQPFLRFDGSCVWLLWVFKFFFGFLSLRRSAWTNALHSFHAALGESETPFFGAPKKRKREKRRKRMPFFAVGGFVGWG
jgi:hypothetical protein